MIHRCPTCGESDRARYGKKLLGYLSEQLTKEFGRGFSFVARQQKITFDGRHFFIDLVFYNYILKCFVIIDLKLGDLRQMQMYVNYYTREMMNKGDNPPMELYFVQIKATKL